MLEGNPWSHTSKVFVANCLPLSDGESSQMGWFLPGKEALKLSCAHEYTHECMSVSIAQQRNMT